MTHTRSQYAKDSFCPCHPRNIYISFHLHVYIVVYTRLESYKVSDLIHFYVVSACRLTARFYFCRIQYLLCVATNILPATSSVFVQRRCLKQYVICYFGLCLFTTNTMCCCCCCILYYYFLS